MEISVKLEVFEGPLDLLLHLIEKNKINIYDIPIAEITEQYTDYIRRCVGNDMDTMSEFLLMAATLLDIKCRMLLPARSDGTDDADDPRSELVERLLEYKMFKYVSHELKDRQSRGELRHFRNPDIPEDVRSYEDPADPDELLAGITLSDLGSVFSDIMRRNADRIDTAHGSFGKIEKDEITVEEQIEYLNGYAVSHKEFRFDDLLKHQKSRTHVIVTFLAVLEMMRTGKIRAEQENAFGDIIITSNIWSRHEVAKWKSEKRKI